MICFGLQMFRLEGNIRHINHDNLKLKNVMWATAIDFGRKYREFADYLRGQEERNGTIYFTGGAVLKNRELQAAIQREVGIQEVVCAADDEVFRGMQKLVLKCVERMDRDETENQKGAGSNRCIPVGNRGSKPAAFDAGVRA